MNARVLLLVALLALVPGTAWTQGPPDPPVLEVAETVSACMSSALQGRIIGGTWVEPTADGYRVAM